MPTSDMIFSVIGVADYLFLLLFIVATGIITRRKARVRDRQAPTEANKRGSWKRPREFFRNISRCFSKIARWCIRMKKLLSRRVPVAKGAGTRFFFVATCAS